MRTLTVVMMTVGLMLLSACGSSGGKSTRVDVRDDTKGPQRSGPYAGDAKEVSEHMVQQIRRQQVVEDYKARWNDEPPIVVMIRPTNNTRFVEVTTFFTEDLLSELMESFTRRDIRFVDRRTQTLAEIEA